MRETIYNFPADRWMQPANEKLVSYEKAHLSRPTSSFAYLALRCVSGYLCRPIESQHCLSRRERNVTQSESVSPGAEGNAATRSAPSMSVICYPKTSAWQIVPPAREYRVRANRPRNYHPRLSLGSCSDTSVPCRRGPILGENRLLIVAANAVKHRTTYSGSKKYSYAIL